MQQMQELRPRLALPDPACEMRAAQESLPPSSAAVRQGALVAIRGSAHLPLRLPDLAWLIPALGETSHWVEELAWRHLAWQRMLTTAATSCLHPFASNAASESRRPVRLAWMHSVWSR